MDAPDQGEHKLVFLNELHETLKRLDPRRVQNAGLFRILGRLVEYDMDRQIIKIESVFHHEYTTQPIVLPTTPAAATATISSRGSSRGRTRTRTRSKSRSKPSKNTSQDDKASNQGITGRHSYRSSVPGTGSGSGVGVGAALRGQGLHRNANNDNKNSTTIDLTLDDDEDEDAIMGEVDHYNSQEEDTSSLSNAYTHHDDPETFKNSCVDLTTSTDDEQDQENTPVTHLSTSDNALVTTAVTTTKPKRAPKVVLWVDTQLLGERAFGVNALFQFMGEVVYCHPVVANGGGIEAVRSSVRGGGGGGGHWVLQARTARLMDGLDLYSYQQAILLTRDLVRRYQERDKEQELAKEKEKEQKDRKEKGQEQEGREDNALVVELE